MSPSDATVRMKALKKPSPKLIENVWPFTEHGTGVKVYPVWCIIVQGVPYDVHGPDNNNNMRLASNPVTIQKILMMLSIDIFTVFIYKG